MSGTEGGIYDIQWHRADQDFAEARGSGTTRLMGPQSQNAF